MVSPGFLVAAAIATSLMTPPASAFAVPPRATAMPRDGTNLSGVRSHHHQQQQRQRRQQRHQQQRHRWLPVASQGQGRGSCVVAMMMMMSEASPPPGKGKFVEMGSAGDIQSFGPRCILASGLSLEDRDTVRSILDEDKGGDQQDQEDSTPLVVFTPELADKRVGDVLTDAPMIGLLQEKQQEAGDSSSAEKTTSPVILISGHTNQELRQFAARFQRATGLRAAFAKAVPKAMTKSVATLCGEIAQDHADALAGKLHGGGKD